MTKFPLNQFEKLKTPFYYYDMELLDNTLNELKKESSKYSYQVHYALKANSHPRVLAKICSYGFGADCVSGGEVQKALDIGFENNAIVFAGVGKTDEEIELGILNEIRCFNCESIQEIEIINQIAKNQNKKVRIAIRINPNVDAKTHKYITTGLEENKFGINVWELEDVLSLMSRCENVMLDGIHFHIGSQIKDIEVFKSLCLKVNTMNTFFKEKSIHLNHVNVGGGLGVNYREPDEAPIVDFKSFFRVFDDFLELEEKQELHFELGRSITANFGSLISRVIIVKNGVKTNFLILDAGMTELIRPALYQSFHKIQNISRATADSDQQYDVVGPICESSDCFGKAVNLPLSKRGDLIAIRNAGAYGEVMRSEYNLRPKREALFSTQ